MSPERRSPEGSLPLSETRAAELVESPSAMDDAVRFHDAVTEWLDLSRELEQETRQPKTETSEEKPGRIWGLERREPKQAVPKATLQDKINAISVGQVGDLLPRATAEKSKVRDERILTLEARLAELDREIARYKDRPDLRPEVRAEFKKERRFQQVGRELDNLETYEDELDRREFELLKTRKGKLGSTDRTILQNSAALHETIQNRVTALETGPETALAARLHELARYRDGLVRDRFAETPSRKKYLEMIRRLWEEGKNVFLTGATGTGKTELFIYLAKKLYGQPPEIIRGSERTGAPEIFGKTLLRATPEGGTETYFQPGRYTAAIDAGRPLIFDEFNLLEPKTRFELKELYNRKPGDTVTVQEDTGKPHTIQEGFGFGATANIKSEKHKERFELDPAESRVFEMRRVPYVPKEELYDLVLSKLGDKRGGVRLHIRDAHLTLQHLAEAAEMIQGARI